MPTPFGASTFLQKPRRLALGGYRRIVGLYRESREPGRWPSFCVSRITVRDRRSYARWRASQKIERDLRAKAL